MGKSRGSDDNTIERMLKNTFLQKIKIINL